MAAGNGLVSMTPTSIAHSGTSASINADGGVDFTAVTSLSLNGVFTSDYDNYRLVLFGFGSTSMDLYMQLRGSGSDATASNYTTQRLLAQSTTVTGQRFTSQTYFNMCPLRDGTLRDAFTAHIYGPALAQPTAYRTVTIESGTGAGIRDWAGTHSLSTSYDGFTFTSTSGNFTGNVHVFGYEE